MYNLKKIITDFNQTSQKKISLNKSWGLVYLQEKNLTLLNNNDQLIQHSVYNASPFVRNKQALKIALDEKKDPLTREKKSAIRNILYKTNTDKIILQRLNWEESLNATLKEESWEKRRNEIESDLSVKLYFSQAYHEWNIHRPFQYYSSEGLLFLLNLIIEYQYHFSQAYQELQQKKRTWIPFFVLPSFIVESYEPFLVTELETFQKLRAQVLDALLLRLNMTEQQGLVTRDDVSYTLALKSQWLGLSTLALPDYRITLPTHIFNYMHRAIEKHGDATHINQLYQLAWYRQERPDAKSELTTINTSAGRLLIPEALVVFFPLKKKKWDWLFSSNDRLLQYLSEQQALFAQLFLSPVHDNIISKPMVSTYPALLTVHTQCQLLQQSWGSLDQQRLRWWQWEKKRWKKIYQAWLGQQLEEKQANLLNCLSQTFEQVKAANYVLAQAKFRQQVHMMLNTIQQLLMLGIDESQGHVLNTMRQYLLGHATVNKEHITHQSYEFLPMKKSPKADLTVNKSLFQVRATTSKEIENTNFLRPSNVLQK